ncbi:MAG: peptidylprolyl isomerase [Yoonia sp.]|uniref:peptidylprolyl isomerase n=1 Tax=Yoonia sp. TaxID=2212373 RepID=UPI00273F2897|nr:peptidylprolyl isomerase [Yoonia sp.]MDP5084861.1 peptidylprolyl isomerase [Yoonia sp.]
MHRGWIAVALIAIAAVMSGGQMVVAQGQLAPAITVNDRVITQYELNQRERLLEVFRTPGDLREVARNGLIEDRLKQQEMARFNLRLSDEALQQELEAFAGRADLTLPQFTQMLSQEGVDISTLQDFVSIGVQWRDFVRGRFGRSVNISDADVERAQARQGAGTTQLEVLLTEIIIAAPPERAAAAQQAADQIAQMRSFAAFEDAARQVSALPSRENGGRLDWLPIDNYPPQLRGLILSLEPGEVTAPINIPNGIALFQLRGQREAARPVQPPVSIDYAIYAIPGGRSDAGLRQAAQVRDQVDTCDDLYGVARNQPAEVLERVTRDPSDISSDVAIELARLDPGEVSTNLTRDNGETLVFLMLCARNNAGAGSADPETIRGQLRSQRLTALSDALLEDLRASAIIRP